METEKLYYQDAFMTDFTARVLSCEPRKGAFLVVLDRTAFYPEGGGQPADHGVLCADSGECAVTDVHQRDGVIYHTCLRPLAPGTVVTGTIDWTRRFDHMQQHSGEHILSGILCRRYHCDNVGFHLGADTVTIDYNAPISWTEALAAEAEANSVIWADQAVEITWPSPENLASLSYRSKKELSGGVRIVTFPAADCCACCGTHVARAGQVGLIKILSCQKFREGVRLEILCGGRALAYLSAVWEQARSAGQRLSVKPEGIRDAVARLEEDLEAAGARATRLEQEVFDAIAREHAGAGDVILFREAMRPDSVRRLADVVGRQSGGLAAVFAGADGSGYAYALVRAVSGDNFPAPDGSAVELGLDVKAMNAALHGRGGGRGGFAQGSVQASQADIRRYFEGVSQNQ